jgi:hypothetical protein
VDAQCQEDCPEGKDKDATRYVKADLQDVRDRLGPGNQLQGKDQDKPFTPYERDMSCMWDSTEVSSQKTILINESRRGRLT